MKETIGQKLSPILQEIEETLIDHAAYDGSKPEYKSLQPYTSGNDDDLPF